MERKPTMRINVLESGITMRDRSKERERLIENVSGIIGDVVNNHSLSAESQHTILDVLQREKLVNTFLSSTEAVRTMQAVVDGNFGAIEKLRLLCMGAWLESTNGFAIEDTGELLVDIQNDTLCLEEKAKENRNMLMRQAIIRQIERWAVLRANGLIQNDPENVKSILDIGAGTLIGSVMLRNRFPEAQITGLEPGLITEKTKTIAANKNIELVAGDVLKLESQKKYDAILLHFVLEHSEQQARLLIREALLHLSENGVLSIAVPNYHAFHRELETATDMNERDTKTRLSKHDHLSGHQIIFDQQTLVELIKEEMDKLNLPFPIQSQTILPRPFAFNTLCAMEEHKKLLDLELSGHIPGMEEKGSVVCIRVGKAGKKLETPVDTTEKTEKIFQELIQKYLTEHGGAKKLTNHSSVQDYLKIHYPGLLATPISQ